MMKTYKRAFPIASGVVKLEASTGYCTVTLIAPSFADESTFTPAQDISIYGMSNIIELRDGLTELIEEYGRKRIEEEYK